FSMAGFSMAELSRAVPSSIGRSRFCRLGARRRIGARREALPSGLLLLEIFDGALDRVLGQHGTMDLHRGQAQLFGDLAVLDQGGIVDLLALDPFGGEG